MKDKILTLLKTVQPDIVGFRWDQADSTLFLIDKDEEMETGEFSHFTLTRYVMEGIERYLDMKLAESYTC